MLGKRCFYVCAGLLCLGLAFLATPQSAQAESGYVYLTQWGAYGTGNGQFYYPWGVATDAAGNIYVADTFNKRIQKFALDPTVDVPVTAPSPTFALEGFYPNPARSTDLTVQFDLSIAAPAKPELYASRVGVLPRVKSVRSVRGHTR